MSSASTPTSPQIPTYLRTLIDEIAVREGFTANAYAVTPTSGSKSGDGFIGVLWAVSVTGERRLADGSTLANDRLALICKLPPADPARREMFHSTAAFTRELYAYNTVLPQIAEFQRAKGIARADGFFQFPKCYGSFADEASGDFVLVLEDLKAAGYQMWDRFETLDFQHASLALGELGKFHALSFVVRDQRPELLKEFQRQEADTMVKMAETEVARPFWAMNYKMARQTLRADETELQEKMKLLAGNFVERMRRLLAVDAAEPFGVLNHGDFWNNNMMYKYAEGDRTPLGVCLIDWQIVQFCSPVIDLAYFLFSSTERQLRQQHFWDLIRVYYDGLARTVRALGSDPERLFRYADLQEQLAKFAEYGMLMAPMLVQVVTAKPEDLPDFDEMSRKVIDKKMDAEFEGFVKEDNVAYRERMSDVIRDFFALGFELH